MDSSPTIPEKTEAKSFFVTRPNPDYRTPCGYRPGPLKASDGTRYLVEASGQIRRMEPKMSKAELKRHRKARRAAAKVAGGDACPTRERS
jgi:hypothetical protein